MRYVITVLALLCVFLSFAATPVQAQEQGAGPSTASNAGLEQRLELSKELHEYISVTDRINDAIDSVAAQLPAGEKEKFSSSMRSVLNYRVIEKASIDTMAELFTVDELKYLIEYHKNPMSKSVEQKFKAYEQRLSPEITRMLDKSMMRVRTGGDATTP